MQTKHLCLRLRADPTHGGMIDGAAVEQRGHAFEVGRAQARRNRRFCSCWSVRASIVIAPTGFITNDVITVDHRLARRVAAYETRDYIKL
jgi:hypothetical protein